MRIDIISVLPELLDSFLNYSIVKRAKDKGVVDIKVHPLRDYGLGRNKQVDDVPFGGEAGMVLMIEPIYTLITKLKSERNYDEIIFLSPDGEQFTQKKANSLSLLNNIILLCGHYKGIDHRIREHLITSEISVGDYVLSGGELASAIVVDAITRIIPGAISDETSALSDSFQDNLLSPPVYTRPEVFNNWNVPKVLLSGNHALIDEWKENEAFSRTKKLRPGLLEDEGI